MKKILLLLSFILFIATISASCNSTQVDINSASIKTLDKIVHIGPSMAQKIIDSRPYDSVDDLIRLKGIGNGSNFADIKAQNLACVNDVNTPEIQSNVSTPEFILNNDSSAQKEEQLTEQISSDTKPIRMENLSTIKLDSPNSQNIKTQNGNEGNRNYAIYGLIGFGILLAGLYIIKIKKTKKNEFR